MDGRLFQILQIFYLQLWSGRIHCSLSHSQKTSLTTSALVVRVAARILMAEWERREARDEREPVPVEGTEASCSTTLSSLSGLVAQL